MAGCCTMPKNKPHKGLPKRVRVTKTGKIKLQSAFGRHLRSHKSGQTIRQNRQPKYAQGPDATRMSRLLMLKSNVTKNHALHRRTKPRTPTES